MLVWILIAACWAGLLLLILHDVTKDDGGRSPVTIASRNTLIAAARGWRKLRKLQRSASAAAAAKAAAAKAAAAAKTTAASTLEAPAQVSPATPAPQTPDASRMRWWGKDRRAQISSKELELTIAEAVRKSAPGCSSFIGVVVHHKKPRQHRDPNWGVRGVKFGKADRRSVDDALARIVEQLQKEFRLTDPHLRN